MFPTFFTSMWMSARGVWMLVMADRFTGRTIDVRVPVQPRRGQDVVHRGRGDAESRGELNRSFPQTHSQADAAFRR